jgi:iron complex outermembrane receptor protein
MKKRLAACLMGICVILAIDAFAEERISETEGGTPVKMADIVVTASRFEERISKVAANVTVITEKDIENSTSTNVPDLLRTQVGVEVTDVAGNGRNFKVDIRGFGETAQSNTLVLVDGRRVNAPDLSGTDWFQIPRDRVARIEVVRGGRGGVLYGDNASGGVVNIITKQGDALKYGGKVFGGSYKTFGADGFVSGSVGDFSFAANAGYYDTDGYRDNSSIESKDVGLNLDYYIGEWSRLYANMGFHSDQAGLPGALSATQLIEGVDRTSTNTPEDFADVDDGYIDGGLEFFFRNESQFLIPTAYRKRSSDFFASFTGGFFQGDTEITTVSTRPQIILREPIFGRSNTLTVGFDYYDNDEDIVNTSSTSGAAEFDLEKKDYGIYVQDDLKLAETLSLSGGYRYAVAEYGFQPSNIDEEKFYESAYNAGINWNFYGKSFTYFGYAHSFRFPVLDELYNFFENKVALLDPQTSDGLDIGVRHYFWDNFYADVSFFRIDTDKEIFFNRLSGPFGLNVNYDGETRRDGVEMMIGLDYKIMALTASYTYTDAEFRDGEFEGGQIPDVPENKATVTAVFDLPYNFILALDGSYIGSRPLNSDFKNEFPDQESYFLLNAKIKYTWKWLTPFLNLNNILNEEYSQFGTVGGFPTEPQFFPSPKFNFLVGLSGEF